MEKEQALKPAIKTFAFLDLETAGLSAKARITELCMVTVQREELIEQEKRPRILSKLNLCFNPRKPIDPAASHLTGLYNDMLENQEEFNAEAVELITRFIKRLPKPVCIIAHNGFRFDYLVLANELKRIGKDIQIPEVFCQDSILAFSAIESEEVHKDSPSLSVDEGRHSISSLNTPPNQGTCAVINNIKLKNHLEKKHLATHHPNHSFRGRKRLFSDPPESENPIVACACSSMEGVSCFGQVCGLSLKNFKPMPPEDGNKDDLGKMDHDDRSEKSVNDSALLLQANEISEQNKCQNNLLNTTKEAVSKSEDTLVSSLEKNNACRIAGIPSVQEITNKDDGGSSQADSFLKVKVSESFSDSSSEKRHILNFNTVISSSDTEEASGKHNTKIPDCDSTTNVILPKTEQSDTKNNFQNKKTPEFGTKSEEVSPNQQKANTMPAKDLALTPKAPRSISHLSKTSPVRTIQATRDVQYALLESASKAVVDSYRRDNESDSFSKCSRPNIVVNSTIKIDLAGELPVIDGINTPPKCTRDSKVLKEALATPRKTPETDQSSQTPERDISQQTPVKWRSPSTNISSRTPTVSTRSFSLKNICQRTLGRPPVNAHMAESDCLTLIEVLQKKSPRILEWLDQNAQPYTGVDFLV